MVCTVLELRRSGYQVYTQHDWDFLIAAAEKCPDRTRRQLVLLRKTVAVPIGAPIYEGPGFVAVFLGEVDSAERDALLRNLDLLTLHPLQCDQNYNFRASVLVFDNWARAERAWRWSLGEQASIMFVGPTETDIGDSPILELNVGALGTQRAIVTLNGESIGQFEVTGFATQTQRFSIPQGILKPSEINELSFRFPDARQPETRDLRVLAIKFESLAFSCK